MTRPSTGVGVGSACGRGRKAGGEEERERGEDGGMEDEVGGAFFFLFSYAVSLFLKVREWESYECVCGRVWVCVRRHVRPPAGRANSTWKMCKGGSRLRKRATAHSLHSLQRARAIAEGLRHHAHGLSRPSHTPTPRACWQPRRRRCGGGASGEPSQQAAGRELVREEKVAAG